MSEREPLGIRGRIEAETDRDRLLTIAARLEAGEQPSHLVADSEDGVADILAAMVLAGLGDDREGGPPLVRSDSPRPGLLDAGSEPALAAMLPGWSRRDRLALSAGLLQILDLWNPSHEAAQEADDLGERAFSPYWHAIAHRREPDPGNAGYWFRRVGRHPQFVDLADAIRPVLDAPGDPKFSDRLLAGGVWNPMAFVAFCGEAARRRGSDAERLARRIQRAEMLVLIDATADRSD